MAAPTTRGSTVSTIEDVARLAGVSRGSVSNVLTGKVRMRDATRERVLEAARALGYQPNRAASALASGRYATIAMLMPDITNVVNADIVKAIEAVCALRGHTVTICHTDKDVGRERAHLDDLFGNRVAGIIAKGEGAEPARYERLLDAGARIVLIDNPILGLDLPIVRLDREQVTLQSLAALVPAGHQRIGVIVTESPFPLGPIPTQGVLADRYIAQRMVERCGQQLGIPLLIEARPLRSLEDGRDAVRALLNRGTPPTAIYATSWLHTMGMLAVVNRLPDAERRSLGLIGTGSGEYLDAVAPWLTRVEHPAHEQGRVAIELMFRQIDGGTVPRGQEIVLPMRLVERASTQPRSSLRTA